MSVHMRPNGSYYAHGRDAQGRQWTKTFGPGEEARMKAEEFDRVVKQQKGAERPLADQSGILYFDTLAQRWLDDKKATGRSLQWLKEWANILQKHLLPELCKKPVSLLTYDDLVGLVMRKYSEHSVITRNRYLSYLKSMCSWAIRHDLMQINPLAHWRKAKEQPRRLRLTLEDLKAIKQVSPPHLSWAIDVAYALGVRPGSSELLALKWIDVDWELGQVQVYGRKTNQLRIIPVQQSFLAKLHEMRAKATTDYVVEYQGKPVKKIARSFKAACKRAGITYEVTAYSIRHLFATNALSNGADLAAVSKLLGHASIQMTANTYYHLLEKEKRRAISLLPPLE